MKYRCYPEYIASRLDPEIEIPKSWEEKRLKFVASHNDETLSESTSDDFEIEYIDISSVDLVNGIRTFETTTFEKAPSRARRKVKSGDTIVSTVRTYLKAIAPIKDVSENTIVSTGFAVIRPREGIDAEYLSYFLQNQYFVELVVANSVGVSYPAINASDLVCIPAYYPKCIDEQQKIAAFLDMKVLQIDDLIEKKKSLIEKLVEKRVAVITLAVTKGIDKNTRLKPSGESWLGDIPEHWEVRRLQFNIKTTKGYAFKSESFTSSGVRVVKASDIKNKTIIGSNVFLPELFAETHCNVILREGDIVISTVGSTPSVANSAVGQLGVVPQSCEGALLNQNTVILKPYDQLLNSFLMYLLSATAFREHLDLHAHGTANQASLNLKDILNFTGVLPPTEEQKVITKHLDDAVGEINRLISTTDNTIGKLEEYRSAIITSAVTGKIDVSKVDVTEREHKEM
jgi:type I restriction enzyme S subunit